MLVACEKEEGLVGDWDTNTKFWPSTHSFFVTTDASLVNSWPREGVP